MEAKFCHDCTFHFTDYAERFHEMSFETRINQSVSPQTVILELDCPTKSHQNTALVSKNFQQNLFHNNLA
jgi:hypothetical protein